MEKDIQKLTQNERYDLKRKQIKEEWNKTAKEITQEDIIKNYREVNADKIIRFVCLKQKIKGSKHNLTEKYISIGR